MKCMGDGVHRKERGEDWRHSVLVQERKALNKEACSQKSCNNGRQGPASMTCLGSQQGRGSEVRGHGGAS